MTRYLLDTPIFDQVFQPVFSTGLQAWLRDQSDQDLFVASLTLAEIRRGILEKPAKQRVQLEGWFYGPEGPQALFLGRILSFDERAGLVWARLMAEGNAAGRPRNPLDMMIAAIAEANGCVIVTDNDKAFAGMTVVNPL